MYSIVMEDIDGVGPELPVVTLSDDIIVFGAMHKFDLVTHIFGSILNYKGFYLDFVRQNI